MSATPASEDLRSLCFLRLKSVKKVFTAFLTPPGLLWHLLTLPGTSRCLSPETRCIVTQRARRRGKTTRAPTENKRYMTANETESHGPTQFDQIRPTLFVAGICGNSRQFAPIRGSFFLTPTLQFGCIGVRSWFRTFRKSKCIRTHPKPSGPIRTQ